MIYNNIELFNVDEIKETASGIKLYRFPTSTIENMRIKTSALLTTGCEIRFTGEARIELGALEDDGFAEIYRGDTYVEFLHLEKGKITAVTLQYNLNADSYCKETSSVWRIVFSHNFCGVLYNIEPLSEIAPPKKDENKKTMLAYGSSITHGACSCLFSCSNIFLLGRLLGADVLNKGVGGGCFCEEAIANYISKANYDILFLELGINMMDYYSADEFYQKASYLIGKADSKKLIIFVSPYTHFRDFSKNEIHNKLSEDYHKMCDKIYRENKRDNFIYLDGRKVLSEKSLLTCDTVHPSIHGHREIAYRIFDEIKERLQ